MHSLCGGEFLILFGDHGSDAVFVVVALSWKFLHVWFFSRGPQTGTLT